MPFLTSVPALFLAAGAVGGSALHAGVCPPGLERPGSTLTNALPSRPVTVTEDVAAHLNAAPERPLDCLLDRDGRVVAALFAAKRQLGAEIVVYEGGHVGLRTLSVPASTTRLDALPSDLLRQIVPAVPDQEALASTSLEPSPTALLAASYNPARPAPANLTENLRVIDYTYDDFGRVESETVDLEGGGTGTISYTYYRNGLRKIVTDTAGSVTFYEYNGVNLLSRVTTSYGQADAQITSYDYWPDRLLKAIHRPNGVTTAYTYDDADRLESVTVTRGQTLLAAYEYGYDANGNRTSQVEENGGAPELTSYEYDELDRLRFVRYPDGRTVTYGYDAVGNRTSEVTRNAAGAVVSDKTAVFDPINRLSTVTDAVDPAGTVSFTYDRNGNLRTKTTAAGTQEHVYDTRDLLVETRDGTSITARFAYDAFGRRYLKIGEEGVRQYLYDQTSVLEELDEHDVLVAKYEYGGSQLQSLVRRDEPRRYYHLDGLGSVTALSDAGGDMVARYHLDAWGNFRNAMELEASRNRFAFTGYLWDRETELYYAKARFYDPVYGRFMTQDSFLGRVEEPPSLHRYFYANANPVRYIDLTGHATKAQVWRLPDNSVQVRSTDTATVYANPTDEQLQQQFDRGEATLDRAVFGQLSNKTRALASTTPDYEKSRFRNFAEDFAFDFSWHMTAPAHDTFEGLMRQDGKQFLGGLAKETVAAAVPFVLREATPALVAKVPILGEDIETLAPRALKGARDRLARVPPQPQPGAPSVTVVESESPIPPSNVAGGSQSADALPAPTRTTPKAGRYEFPDQAAGGTPYVGQSGNIPRRLAQHERAGRLTRGTETTTAVEGGKTAREIAEHKRIQELTGGVPASQSSNVSNKVDPIGAKRRYLLGPGGQE